MYHIFSFLDENFDQYTTSNISIYVCIIYVLTLPARNSLLNNVQTMYDLFKLVNISDILQFLYDFYNKITDFYTLTFLVSVRYYFFYFTENLALHQPAEEYLEVWYCSRACCGQTVHRSEWVRKQSATSDKQELAGGSRWSTEHTPRVHIMYTGNDVRAT